MRFELLRGLILGALVAALVIPAGMWAETMRPGLADQDKKQEPKKPQEPQGEFAISVEVPLVQVDVVVTDRHGSFLTGLKKENFRVTEDGEPQVITNFAPTEAPITMVILMEFSKLGYEYFAYLSRIYAYDFLDQLNKEDWVALMTYDLRTRIEVDFTQNKFEVRNALSRMYFPGFSEANLFDAMIETMDRLKDVKGKKSILIMASGYDTFSKHHLDDALKAVRDTDVTIFAVGVARDLIEYLDSRGLMGGIGRVDYAQAENQLRTFARTTGGEAWFPRFQGEIPGIFRQVAAMLRNQYSLAYIPKNRERDGKFRKIKVELVDENGNELEVKDQKGKKLKFLVYAKQGYIAPEPGVAD